MSAPFSGGPDGRSIRDAMTSAGTDQPATGVGTGATAGLAGMPRARADGSEGGPAQHATRHWCATMHLHHRLLDRVPEYPVARAVVENHTRSLMNGRTGPLRTSVARIPVVVHVVWQTEEQNISDEQVHSQIVVLNTDFRAANPEIPQVPEAFRDLAGDALVEFHLADVDPAGNPTTGITRTRTSRDSFSADDEAVKSSATGGADAWPAARYLNVWVCRLTGGLLGYAQFPGGPPQTDGVVITYTAFGTTGTATAPFNLGRTTTHEVGHYLNLFHIWGDDGTGCGGTDEVADTPNQAGPNSGSPTYPRITCGNGPHGDLFVNFMDYVDDGAMVMFTKGQTLRMQACLDAVRSSLLATGRTAAPVTSAAAPDPGRLDVFRTGLDSGLYHKWWDGTAWQPSSLDYEYLGGTCLGEPQVVSPAPGRVDVFVRAVDRALCHKWWDGAAWQPSSTGFEDLGGACLGDPVAVCGGPGRLDILVRGMDRALYHKWWDGAAWQPSPTGYVSLGGVCTSEPVLTSCGLNRLDVFVVGADSALQHKWWDGTAWHPSPTGYENLGGICAGRPQAVGRQPDRLDVIVLGADSALYHKWWDGTAWHPSPTAYECLGGVCVAAPQVIRSGPDRVDVFVLGPDSALHHKWWNGTSWLPGATSFENLGAAPTRSPTEGLVSEWQGALVVTHAGQ